ncbi:acyl-CoA dehydrogenase family protein [Pseudonocardia sp. KRD291]|uniref:acyl-CoA dehydrogenase family protein n=1 Tax=Pseudonocardia sp. KRD291 TaxID=2792007 RepID=UPI001C49E8E9|nr:acyl-CoA dehydrogenase family protein [Pseudonocardia sp. KRD291]MBW0101979.1 acyl-CoA/acyl-ACP dehydrogenase [Pseudonocardia sp. KRD291]
MFFALTDDQREFDAAVRGYLAERFDLEAVRGVVEDADGNGHPDSLWKAAAEQGWLAVLVPEEHEGLGLGLVEAQVIARALGAGAAPGPWRGTVLAAEAIRLAGSDEQKARWLPKLSAGEAVGAFSLRGTAPGALPAVEYGNVADVVVVRTADGLGLSTSFTATPVGSFDGTSRVATLQVDDVEPLPGSTAEVLRQLTDRATVLVAADLVGIAREAVSRTVAYDRERQQFGVPVGSFQAIKHAMADLHVGVTMAEHAALYAAYAVDAGTDDADLAVAVAKAKCSEVALQATAAMIQYHGGIGYTWEHEAHFFYKRAKRLAGQFGDVDAQRERIAALTI